MEQAVAYLRVSRATSDTQRQERELQDYAKRNDINLIKTFSEQITGASLAIEREQFNAMLKYIEKHKIDLILTTEISRFGRNKLDVIQQCEDFIKKKIQVIFTANNNLKLLNDKKEKDWLAGMIILILSSFAEIERETTLARNKSGMINSIKNGGSGYGLYKPYGYKKVEYDIGNRTIKKLEVCEEEKKTVELIFDKYLQGLGCKQIANHLNNLGIKTRTQKIFNPDREIKTRKNRTKPVKAVKWTDGTVYSILRNRIYIGERRINEYSYNKDVDEKGRRYKKDRTIINTHVFEIDPIIDIDTFNKVQNKLTENYSKSGNHNKYENILKDKITCGICKRNYWMHKRANNKDNAYKCISIRDNANCGNIAIGIDRLNNALYVLLNGYVKYDNENKKYIKKLKIKEQNLIIIRNNTLKEIEIKNKSFRNILELNIADDNFQKIITDQYNRLKDEIDELNKEYYKILQDIEDNKQLIKNLKNVKLSDIVQDATTFKKYVHRVIHKITVNRYNDRRLKTIYTNKQDKTVHVTVTTIDKSEHTFILSQRTNIMLLVMMQSFYGERRDVMITERTPFENTFLKIQLPKKITIDNQNEE